uniref:EH domain-containing protein n=1 Tax=Esox lucius TaxID=8010 RepID=A0A3P8Z3Q3_ESOLU
MWQVTTCHFRRNISVKTTVIKMALRPGSGGGGSFIYPVGGSLGPPQGMMPIQQPQQQPFPGMVQVPMQPSMQGMMGMNFRGQIPPGAIPMQGGMTMGMQAPGIQFMGQPQFMGMRAPGPQYTADMQKQMAEEHQKRVEQQQRMLEEDRKRRQFEEQKQKLRLLSSVKPKGPMGASRDDALEAIKGNLDGFSRDAKMHPTPSSHPKKPDSSPSHSSVTSHSPPPAFPDDHDDFTDFMQGPVDASSSSASLFPSSPQAHPLSIDPGAGRRPSSAPLPQSLPVSVSIPTATQHSTVNSSSQSAFQGPSLEEKLFSSCDLTAEKKAQVSFKPQRLHVPNQAPVSAQYQTSTKARNWAEAPGDLSSAFTVERPPEAPTQAPAAQPPPTQTSRDGGVGGYPQEHIQPMVPGWLYNDSLIPEMFKKVLEFTMTPGGIDTAKLYPILMSSGLPREALGQIWASANRTTPGMLTKEELYTVLALIGVAQSGLPAMNVEILSQFPSPPVPNLPALAMALAPVLPQQPMMTQPPVPVTMAMPSTAPSVMTMVPLASTQPNTNFVTNFPPIQGTKADDDDFQDFQEAPKAGGGDQSFSEFQGESGGSSFPTTTPSHVPSMLTPVTGSSSAYSDKYAVFKQLTVEPPPEPTQPASDFGRDKYSVFRQLEPPADRKPVGEGFADFKSVSVDDGFTDFKTADSISPLDPPDQAKMFQPAFPPAFPISQSLPQLQHQPAVSLSQPKNPLNMADLDLFSMVPSAPAHAPADTKPGPFPSVVLPPGGAKPTGGGPDDFGDFALFGPASSAEAAEDARSGDGGTGVRGEANTASQLLHTGGSFSSLKSESLVDKVAMFKHGGKEDSSSVKSLDLPSIGGSSVGKEDSEDTLSVQLDMKLSDMGGDLKHVMSDSSLDLPGLSAHQPPAAEGDDMKFDPFGTSAVSSMACYDWSDREECLSSQGQVKRHAGLDDAGSSSFPSSAVVHRKETLFSSTENITVTRISQTKITTFSTEDNVSADSKFEALADFGSGEPGGLGGDEDDDFGDFASTVSETSESPAAMVEPGSEGNLNQASDDFGAFQGDKAKFGKSDFLKASSQTKVKSSEEMIKSELATFDLSVQGTHKRSHSLGEKEIGRSPPSPAPEQPFRDRSNTLSEKPALPVIRDKYKDLTGEVEESERYAYEWQRCLESALQVITKANNTLNSISSSTVCTEVIQSAQGMEYLLGVVEVYRVTKRVELGVKATAVCSEKLQQLLKDISRVWNNLMGFMSLANLAPDESSLDFSSCILRHGIKNAKELACGVCLLNVDSRSKAFNSETDNFKLLYGGHQYHASCANFWINCVEPKPPGLILPDLL